MGWVDEVSVPMAVGGALEVAVLVSGADDTEVVEEPAAAVALVRTEDSTVPTAESARGRN